MDDEVGGIMIDGKTVDDIEEIGNWRKDIWMKD